MTVQKFEFDVAFSFGSKDEALANQLHDQLEGRLTSFLYSKQQEMLAGTDGEQRFNEVFGSKARLVVVLFREAWGTTPFTRFEETAIRNRAFSEGYDFTIFIPTDPSEKSKVPGWLPRNRLFVGLDRWGVAGAAAAIEARFIELAGIVKTETIDDFAAKASRALDRKQLQKAHLESEAGVQAQAQAYEILRAGLLEAAGTLKFRLQSINLVEKHDGNKRGDILFLSTTVSMKVCWRLAYRNTLTGAALKVTFWDGHPPWPGILTIDTPRKLAELQFTPELMLGGKAGWIATNSRREPVDTSNVIKAILKFFLTKVEGQ